MSFYKCTNFLNKNEKYLKDGIMVTLHLKASSGWQDIGMHLLTAFVHTNNARPANFVTRGLGKVDNQRHEEFFW